MRSVLACMVGAALAGAMAGPVRAAPAAAELRAMEIRPLNFGMIVVDDVAGVITVAPDGNESCLNLRCVSAGHPGIIRISGADDYAVQVLVSDATLRGPNGGEMQLTPLLGGQMVSLRPENKGLDLPIGGKLSVGALQEAGRYLGTFEVTIEYQ